MYHKANWILSDGTFYYGQEGSNAQEPYDKSEWGKELQKYTNVGEIKYHQITANIMQAFWVFTLLGITFCYKIRENATTKKKIRIIQITVIGIICFNLLFEARARYFINHLPFFILVATCGIKNNYQCLNNKIIKLKKTRSKK